MNIKGITVCVNYSDILEITLVRNLRFLSEILVVTSPNDTKTHKLVAGIPNARCWITDAFYRYGAYFNKGLALEEGFTVLGRDGWILIHDADILFPDNMVLNNLQTDRLYGARRRVLDDYSLYNSKLDTTTLPLTQEWGIPGYFQLFHSASSVTRAHPWYDVTFKHAGGGDGAFQDKWSKHQKVWLPFEVLHLGPRDTNWCGKDNIKDMSQISLNLSEDKYRQWKPEVDERLSVPGYLPTSFRVFNYTESTV